MTLRDWYGLATVTVIGTIIRTPGLFNDLWLDEIWSLDFVSGLSSPVQILTGLAHDNNHPLNSLFLFVLGSVPEEWKYRLLSWSTGVGTVWLSGLVGRRLYARLHPDEPQQCSHRAGILTAWVFATSYIQVQYSSEARGYAPAVFFGLAALYAMLRGSPNRSATWILAYWSACVLGMLSHAIFIPIQVGCGILSSFDAYRTAVGWHKRIAHVIEWNLVPGVALLGYELVFLRYLVIGGGPVYEAVSVFTDTARFAFGMPRGMGLSMGLPLMTLLAIASLIRVGRIDLGLSCSFAVAALGAVLAGGLNPTRLFYPRYLLVTVAVLQLQAGYLLTRTFATGRGRAAAASLALFLMALGGLLQTVRLWQVGRGQYQLALREILQRTPGDRILVSSDHDFRNSTVIRHHARALASEGRLAYYSRAEIPPGGVQWFFRHGSVEEHGSFPEALRINGLVYRLRIKTDYAPPSGWNWYLYSRDE